MLGSTGASTKPFNDDHKSSEQVIGFLCTTQHSRFLRYTTLMNKKNFHDLLSKAIRTPVTPVKGRRARKRAVGYTETQTHPDTAANVVVKRSDTFRK